MMAPSASGWRAGTATPAAAPRRPARGRSEARARRAQFGTPARRESHADRAAQGAHIGIRVPAGACVQEMARKRRGGMQTPGTPISVG